MTLVVPAADGPSGALRAARARGRIEYERCRRSVLYWAERFAFTRDERDIQHPYKPLIAGPHAVDPKTLVCRPLRDDHDDYLRWLTLVWATEPLVVVPKSRQLRVSWWAMAMQTWLVQFRPAQRVAVQSKKLGDADKMLERAAIILELQRKVAPIVPWPGARRRFALVKLHHQGAAGMSRIEALAQGGDKIRSEAYSSIFSDEAAFQPEAENSFAATMPLLEAGARYLVVSSAKGGTFFEQLQNDILD